MGGFWSSYWYNGYIYGAGIARGVDVLQLTPSVHLSQNEIDAETDVELTVLTAQNQTIIEWTPSPAVARAYLDQLARRNGIRAAHVTAIDGLLDQLDQPNAELPGELDALATELEGDARLLPNNASRLNSLAETLQDLSASLR